MCLNRVLTSKDQMENNTETQKKSLTLVHTTVKLIGAIRTIYKAVTLDPSIHTSAVIATELISTAHPLCLQNDVSEQSECIEQKLE